MSSNEYRRPATPATPITGIKWNTFMTAKGYSGASPSREIPVLPLISHPLWRKTSDLRSILSTKVDPYPYPTPSPKLVPYIAFNDLPEMTPVASVYDYVPYTSNHRMQTKKQPSGTSNRNSGSSTSNGTYIDLPESTKMSSCSRCSKSIYNDLPASSKWSSGCWFSEGAYNDLPLSSIRFSGSWPSKGTYNDQLQSTSTSKGPYNKQPQSSKIKSGSTAPKGSPNQQTSKRNSGSSAPKGVYWNALPSADPSISRDEFADLPKEIKKSPGYPWHDVPLISHESLQVTKNTSCQEAATVLEEAVEVKPRRSPTRHPSTVSHLYRRRGKRRNTTARPLPPVKMHVIQENTEGEKQQSKAGQQEEKAPKPSRFKMMYFSGDLPVRAHSTARGNVLRWTSHIDDLDYKVYLPLFFEGLRYKEEPWCFFARQGCLDLLNRHSSRVFDSVGELVKPIKEALDTRNKAVMCHTLRIVQKLLSCAPNVGRALIPHLHSILPILSHFLNDKFTYEETRFGIKGTKTLGEVIDGTLRVMEEYGGRDAFLYIKLLIPTYESCRLNKNR